MSSSSRDARVRLRNESRKQQKLLPPEYRTKLRQLCEITQTDPKTFARSTKGGDPKVTCDREKSDTGHHEKAAYHAHTARAHAIHARGHAEEATVAHSEEHGKK